MLYAGIVGALVALFYALIGGCFALIKKTLKKLIYKKKNGDEISKKDVSTHISLNSDCYEIEKEEGKNEENFNN